MSTHFYTNNFDRLGDWETDTYLALLHNRGSFDPSTFTGAEIVVDDVIATYGEASVSGYTRATVTTPTRSVSFYTPPAPGAIDYNCDPLAFGSPLAGQFDAMTLYREVTDDTDSLVIASFTFSFASGDGTPFTVTPSSGIGLFTLTAQTAPSLV